MIVGVVIEQEGKSEIVPLTRCKIERRIARFFTRVIGELNEGGIYNLPHFHDLYLHIAVKGNKKIALIADTRRGVYLDFAKEMLDREVSSRAIQKNFLHFFLGEESIKELAGRMENMLMIMESKYFDFSGLRERAPQPFEQILKMFGMLQIKRMDGIIKDLIAGRFMSVLQTVPRLLDGAQGDLARALAIAAAILEYERFGSNEKISVEELHELARGIKSKIVKKVAYYLISEIETNGTLGLREVPIYVDPSTVARYFVGPEDRIKAVAILLLPARSPALDQIIFRILHDEAHNSFMAGLSAVEMQLNALITGNFQIILPSVDPRSPHGEVAAFLEELRMFMLSRENIREKISSIAEKWAALLEKIKKEQFLLNRHVIALAYLGLKLVVNIMPVVFHIEEAKRRMKKYEDVVRWLVELVTTLNKKGHEAKDVITVFSAIALSAATQYLRVFDLYDTEVPELVAEFDYNSLKKLAIINDNLFFLAKLSLLSALGNTVSAITPGDEPILGDIVEEMLKILKLELPDINPVHVWAFMSDIIDFARKGNKIDQVISFIDSIEHAVPPLVYSILSELKRDALPATM